VYGSIVITLAIAGVLASIALARDVTSARIPVEAMRP